MLNDFAAQQNLFHLAQVDSALEPNNGRVLGQPVKFRTDMAANKPHAWLRGH
jgi:hypothetical protein